MQDLLATLLQWMAAHPAETFGFLGAGMFAILVWGVISTSYRYR